MHYPPSNCADTRAALPLFVGGDLEPQELAQVSAHLDDCETCRLHEDRARQARGALVSMLLEGSSAAQGASGVNSSVWEGVRAGLVEEGLLAGSESLAGSEVLVPQSAAVAGGLGGRQSAGDRSAGKPSLLTRIPRMRVASFAAAAGLVFALGVIHFLDDGSGLGGNAHPGALGGSATSNTHAAAHTDAPGYLRRVGPNGSAIHESALEMIPEQWRGIRATGTRGKAAVAGSPTRRLRPASDGQ